MADIAGSITGGDRRKALTALRELIANALEPAEHENGCGCECGPPPADPRALAALSRELRAVLLEIDKLPGSEVVSELDRIADRIDAGRDELAERRENRRAAGADPSRA